MSDEMPSSIKLKVISSHRLLFEGNVDDVTLPGLNGYLGILPGHRPLFTALGEGKLTFQKSGSKRNFEVKEGYAEVKQESVLVFMNPKKDKNEHSNTESK
ncbi:MAG: FoF1 ATP synthase subunit delta/epsilon [Acidobacteriota bacterium]